MQIDVTYKDGKSITEIVNDVTPTMIVTDPIAVASIVREHANTRCNNWKRVDFTIIGVGNYKEYTLVNDDYKTVLVVSRSNTAIVIHEYEQNGLTFIKSIVV